MKLLRPPESSSPPSRQLPETSHVLDGVGRQGNAAGTPLEETKALNRVLRAAAGFDESHNVVDEYDALRVALTSPRRHQFLHFGCKWALSAPYFGFRRSVTADAVDAPNSDTDEFELHKELSESSAADSAAQMPKMKRSPNRIFLFDKRIQPPATEGDGVKRASHNNIMHFGNGTKEEDVANALDIYSTVDGAVIKRAGNAILHSGKRGGLEGKPVFDLATPGKRSPNTILHFGKRPNSSRLEVEAEDEMTKDNRGLSEHRIMHFGKRESDDLSKIMASDIEGASTAADKRAAATRNQCAARIDQIHFFTGIGKQLQRHLREWKRRNRILHLHKEQPQQLHMGYHQAKRLGNRIMHLDKRTDNNFYPGKVGPADEVKENRLKHSIMHNGKRDEDVVSVRGGDKRNQIMHFEKQFGSDQDMRNRVHPTNQLEGNRIVHFGKRLEGSHIAASSQSRAYGTVTNPSLQIDVSQRAHQVLHFVKLKDNVVYKDKGMEAVPLVMESDPDGFETPKMTYLHYPEVHPMIRKKSSTLSPGPNEDIEDTLAQLTRETKGEDGYADRPTMGQSSLSAPLHLRCANVAALEYANAFPFFSRPRPSDRLIRAAFSREYGAEIMPGFQLQNEFPAFG